MSYIEAIKDNIGVEKDNYNRTIYYPTCIVCGNEITSYSYIRGENYKCTNCKSNKKDIAKVFIDSLNISKQKKNLINAIDKLSKTVDINTYDTSIKLIYSKLDILKNVEEIIIVLELLKNGYEDIKITRKDKYGVRIFIPSKKIIIELLSVKKNRIFEWYKSNLVGFEWDIVRVPKNTIVKNILKLTDEINLLFEKRNKI